MDTDRNLLFGVLALQADLIDTARFVEACTAWSTRKGTPLADLLVERGWLGTADRADVDRLLERKLKKHKGDAGACLAEAAPDELRRSLDAITDPDVRESLTTLVHSGDGREKPTVAYEPAGRDRYTLTRLQAKGGIGQVWLARDGDLGREVALKELLPERSDSAAIRARFLEEARITGQLEHPNIVPVYELARPQGDGREPFYTMRFVRGRTLAAAIKGYHRQRRAGQAGPLELRELLTAFVAVCNAVGYAHSRGVLHRDLKPGNVVLGGFGEVIVLDWGLAKVKGEQDPQSSLPPVSAAKGAPREGTLQGQVLGTPAYMPPEQARGETHRVDERSDVYGLGAVLYDLLTGAPPFDGPDTMTVLAKVVADFPVSPRRRTPDAPPALEAVCLKALEKDPSRRYESAKALAADVERWMADEPVAAWREPLRARAGRWVRKHRTRVATALAALAVAVLGLLAVAAVQAESGRRMADKNRELEAANLQLTHARERLAEKNGELEQANARLAQARDRAERRVGLSVAAIENFRSAVDGNLDVKNRPENEGLRKTLLQAPLAFYQKLRDDLKASVEVVPEGRVKLADAYLRLATLDRDIGSQADALRAYDEAVDLLGPLSQEAPVPQRGVLRMQLARALIDRGELQSVSSSLSPAALESFGRAREILQAHMQERDVAARLELARALGDVANAEAKRGRVDSALATLRESLSGLEEASRVDPDHVGAALQRADAHLQIGVVLHNQRGQIPEALAAAESALRIVEPLARTRPGDSGCQLKLAEVYEALGSLHESRSEVDEALSDYNKRLTVVDALAAANPTVTNYRYHRVLALCSVASCACDLGQNDTALATLKKGRDLAAALVRDNPANLKYQKALGKTWNLTAGPQYALGRIPDAIASIEAYAAVLADINRADPADLATLRSINGAHYNCGLLNSVLGRTDKALAAYERSRQLLERLAREHPDNPEIPFDLAATLGNVGIVQRNQHRYREAGESFRRAIETLSKLSAAHPENAQYQSYLIRAQLNLGDVLSGSGRTSEAIAVLRSAQEAAERMAKERPGVVQYQEDRADGLIYLTTALRKAGQADEALATCKEGIGICDGLLKSNPESRVNRSRLADLLGEQGALVREGGRPGEAVNSYQRAVALLEGIASPSADHLGELGRCHARLAGLAAVPGSGLPAEAARAEADKSIEALRRAVTAGFVDAELLRSNSDFDPVRTREDFRKLQGEVEAKAAK